MLRICINVECDKLNDNVQETVCSSCGKNTVEFTDPQWLRNVETLDDFYIQCAQYRLQIDRLKKLKSKSDTKTYKRIVKLINNFWNVYDYFRKKGNKYIVLIFTDDEFNIIRIYERI